jgi:hypothetical protein
MTHCLVCGGDHQPSPTVCDSEGMDRQAERMGARRWNRITTVRRKHCLYKTGDPDAPPNIQDRNGEVALNLCRHCGLAEIELVMVPLCRGSLPLSNGERGGAA